MKIFHMLFIFIFRMLDIMITGKKKVHYTENQSVSLKKIIIKKIIIKKISPFTKNNVPYRILAKIRPPFSARSLSFFCRKIIHTQVHI